MAVIWVFCVLFDILSAFFVFFFSLPYHNHLIFNGCNDVVRFVPTGPSGGGGGGVPVVDLEVGVSSCSLGSCSQQILSCCFFFLFLFLLLNTTCKAVLTGALCEI